MIRTRTRKAHLLHRDQTKKYALTLTMWPPETLPILNSYIIIISKKILIYIFKKRAKENMKAPVNLCCYIQHWQDAVNFAPIPGALPTIIAYLQPRKVWKL